MIVKWMLFIVLSQHPINVYTYNNEDDCNRAATTIFYQSFIFDGVKRQSKLVAHCIPMVVEED